MTARFRTAVLFFVNGMLFATWVSRIPDVKSDLHLGDARLGVALFTMALGTLAALPLSRLLIQRFGAADVTRMSALACCLALAAAGAAPSLPLLLAALPAFGASLGVMDVAMNSQASHLEQAMSRSIMASFHGLFSLGGLSGAVTGSVLAACAVPRAHHLVALASALGLLTLLAGSRGEGAAPAAARMSLAHLPRGVLLVGLVATCGATVEGGIAEWSAVYLRDELHTGAGFAPVGFAAFSLAMMVGRFAGDRLLDAWGRVAVLRAGAALAALALLVTLLAGHPWVAVAGFGVAGLGLATVFPIAFGSAGRLEGVAPGAAIATVAAMGYGGGMLGPPCIGFLSGATTLPWALGTLVVLSAAMALLSGVLEATPRT